MALAPASMSDKNLAKFRTKLCERLLAQGSCKFGDKCQYSHDTAWRRRNPNKHRYWPAMCPELEACRAGAACPFAHSADERDYHPTAYKTVMCRGDDQCGGHYCPYAHTAKELRAAPAADGGPSGADVVVPRVTVEPPAPGPGPGESGGSWWSSDGGDILVSTQQAFRSAGDGEALLGGRVRDGRFREGRGGPEVACRVKLVCLGRLDAEAASRAVRELKELRRWSPGSALAIRRTVATIAIALPDRPSTVAVSVGQKGFRLTACARSRGPMLTLAGRWASQLVQAVSALHRRNIAHLCIGPSTVDVTMEGDLVLGDNVGKVQLQGLLSGRSVGPSASDDLVIWYPKEVHDRLAAEPPQASDDGPARPDVDGPAVDAWQVGVVVFYMLVGGHPFGDLGDPKQVRGGIAGGRPSELGPLRQLPLLADLVGRLLAPAAARPGVLAAHRHPTLWTTREALELASRCLEGAAGREAPPLGPLLAGLAQLPALAPLAGAAAEACGGEAAWVAPLCTAALRGGGDGVPVGVLAEGLLRSLAGGSAAVAPEAPAHAGSVAGRREEPAGDAPPPCCSTAQPRPGLALQPVPAFPVLAPEEDHQLPDDARESSHALEAIIGSICAGAALDAAQRVVQRLSNGPPSARGAVVEDPPRELAPPPGRWAAQGVPAPPPSGRRGPAPAASSTGGTPGAWAEVPGRLPASPPSTELRPGAPAVVVSPAWVLAPGLLGAARQLARPPLGVSEPPGLQRATGELPLGAARYAWLPATTCACDSTEPAYADLVSRLPRVADPSRQGCAEATPADPVFVEIGPSFFSGCLFMDPLEELGGVCNRR